MGGAATADAIEGDDVIDPEPAGNARVWSRDAYRQCSPGDPKCSPTKFEHFRHERQMVRCSLGVSAWTISSGVFGSHRLIAGAR
jgi:hypothetical protein